MFSRHTSSIRLGAKRNSLDPDFCSSTVVNGSGFLQVQVHQRVALIPSTASDLPFLRRFSLHVSDLSHGRLDAHLVKHHCNLEIKQVSTRPFELDVVVVPLESNRDVPERLGHKVLHPKMLIADESERRILAGPCKCDE
jgi:hypothetical protein